jgi:hypothetical protein
MANTPRIIDPSKFILLGALVDWTLVYRKHKQTLPPPAQIAATRKLTGFGEGKPQLDRIVQLRWLLAPESGYPTQPFTVWRRPAMPAKGEAPIAVQMTNFFGLPVAKFDRPRFFVRLSLQCTGPGLLVAYSGVPFMSALAGVQTLVAGFNSVKLSAPEILSLYLSAGTSIVSITGLEAEAATDPAWQPIEIVGLPVQAGAGGAGGGYASMTKQGLIGALGDPGQAALDRFARGAPFYGWDDAINATLNAPAWTLAEPKAMVEVMRKRMLEPLRQMLETLPPNQQSTFNEQHVLNAVGGGGDPATTDFKPLQTLVFGAATDPLASLISGYGTAYIDMDLPPIVLSERKLFDDPTRSDWDYMVTARFEKGEDGASQAVEYAAIVFAPGLGNPPPVPTNMLASLDGLRSPATTNGDWRTVTRVSWDQIDEALSLHVGSYAFARAALAPAGGVVPLMDKRPLETAAQPALQPISASTSPEQEKLHRLMALDERYAVASAPNPNALLYALAHQNIFGLWSAWSAAPFAVGEPPVRPVSIIGVRLDVAAVAAGNCPGTLVLEFAWDWATRSPLRIELVGRLYAQAKLGAAPANLVPPAGLQARLGAAVGGVMQVAFTPAGVASVSSGTPGLSGSVQYLALDGKTLSAAPVLNNGPRRYRLTVTGFQLDFNSAPKLGLALWARGVEFRAPQRIGPFSSEPAVASTADPRPPVLAVEHEDVLLASMPDAAGEHHARIEWPAAPGAAGYFVYTCTEEKLRADRNMATALKSLTLSQRLSELRNAFAANPSRRSFTRVNATPVAQTSLQVTLPRGSKEIHLYVVLANSAGQVESDWPTLADPKLRKRPIAYAAPQVVLPTPPDLEVARVLDSAASPPVWRAQVKVRSKPGAAVARVDLHRVRVPEAALALDTMGPPIAKLSGTTGPWTVKPMVSAEAGVAQTIGVIEGKDAVEGSWKRVFYRAVAWAGDDPARGLYGGRSAPSAPREVVVPPATPPDLSALVWHWPGGALPDVQVDASSAAPVPETPLGPHRLQVSVVAQKADGSSSPLFIYPAATTDGDRFDKLPSAPPAANASGLWRDAAGGLHLLLRRADVADTLRVRWLLNDPLGRSTERTLNVPAGSPLRAPDILNPVLNKVVGKGYVLGFSTTVPIAPTPAGPYVLRVKFLPAGSTAQAGLNTIKLLTALDNPFAELTPIPLRISKGLPRQGTPIGIYLRGAGGFGASVQVSLTGPDGRVAKFTRTVP